MCDYQVEVLDIILDGSAIYITNNRCLAHSNKLLEYSVTNATDTMFDVESFRKDELNKLSRKPCEFWNGYYTFEPCSAAIKVRSGLHPLSPADYQLIVECDAGHKRNFLFTKDQMDMMEKVALKVSYSLLEHTLKEYKTCGDVPNDEQLLLLNVSRPDSQEDEVEL